MPYLCCLCLLAHSGVQNILCCVFALFVFVLCLIYGGVQHILCCVFALFVFVLCLIYGGVQNILRCVFALFVFVLCLIYGGVQHILCCVCFLSTSCAWWYTTHIVMCFCFVCLRLVSDVPNVASFSGLSILDYPFGFSNVYLCRLFHFILCLKC
jgi:hypothetical protein